MGRRHNQRAGPGEPGLSADALAGPGRAPGTTTITGAPGTPAGTGVSSQSSGDVGGAPVLSPCWDTAAALGETLAAKGELADVGAGVKPRGA